MSVELDGAQGCFTRKHIFRLCGVVAASFLVITTLSWLFGVSWTAGTGALTGRSNDDAAFQAALRANFTLARALPTNTTRFLRGIEWVVTAQRLDQYREYVGIERRP